MLVVTGLIAFLISSALDTNSLKVLVSIALLILILKRLKVNQYKVSVSREFIALFVILTLTIVNAIFYFVIADYSVEVNSVNQLLGIRKFTIETIFGVLLYLFLKDFSIDYIFQLLYIGAVANCVVAFIELPFLIGTSKRASLLFFEPSSAGFYYCFSVFLLYLGVGDSLLKRKIAIAFTILGLIAFSKAQFLVLLLIGLIALPPRQKYALATVFISLYLIFNYQMFSYYDSLLDTNLQVYGLDRMVSALGEMGIYGLSNEYEVSDTYVTRLSGIYVSLMAIIDNPLGIGVATFNPYYKQYLVDHGLVNVFIGKELDVIMGYNGWASPRSRILELCVATGLLGVFLLGYIFRSFYRFRKECKLLYVAFLSTFIAGVLLELNPIIDYFVILILILEKLREQKVGSIKNEAK